MNSADQLHLVELLGAISSALAKDGGMRPVLQDCCQALVDHIGAAFARIWIVEPETKILRLQASAGMYTQRSTSCWSQCPCG